MVSTTVRHCLSEDVMMKSNFAKDPPEGSQGPIVVPGCYFDNHYRSRCYSTATDGYFKIIKQVIRRDAQC